MGSNRIQKLLFSEYSDLEDTVLIESSFAETTRQGDGLRQVQIGLTPTKLILAQYAVKSLEDQWPVGDPDIDSFELVCAYPVECVNLTVFRHRKRKSIKACFSNGKVHYFEIGGWQERKMLWSVWCERIKFLSPYESATSVSETSVASSSSAESLYIVRSNFFPTSGGKRLLWCHYSSSQSSHQGLWADPHLYLGPSFLNKGVNSDHLLFSTFPERGNFSPSSERFSKNIALTSPEILSAEYELMAREAVELWESTSLSRKKPRRLWGFYPFPGLLSGLGLWSFSRAETFSLQTKRSCSMVHLQDCDVQFGSCLTSAQLVRTVSQESLCVPALSPDNLYELAKFNTPQTRVHFWTRGDEAHCEWRRGEYQAQQKHLRLLRRHSSTTVILWQREVKNSKKKSSPNFSRRNRLKSKGRMERSSEARLAGGDTGENNSRQQKDHVDMKWKFKSSRMAHQLTMVDKDLFQQLTTLELGRLRKDKCSTRTPHLRALLSFSHRVSCLVATQVLAGNDVRERAICIVKCIGVAYRCHKLQSLQSTVSVLSGLQCPAVYRLHKTWAYVRSHHASKYRRYEDLSRRYLDPRLPLYQRTFDTHSQSPPYLPCVALLVAGLLGTLPALPRVSCATFSSESFVSSSISTSNPWPLPLRKLLSALSIPSPRLKQPPDHSTRDDCHQGGEVQLEDLAQYFTPVTADCPARRLLQDLNYFLETSQAAAARYVIPHNVRVRALLLHSRYESLLQLLTASQHREPASLT